jgi:surface protein
MFENCTELTSLDLSNFETSSLSILHYMFSGCKQLEYINLYLYNEIKSITNIYYIFQNVPENLVICINKNNHIYELSKQIMQKSCPTIYCGDDWKAHQIQMENNTCLYDNTELTEETTNIIDTSSYNKPETEISNTYKTYIEKTNNWLNNEKTYINPTDVISTEKEEKEEISTNLNLEKTDIKKYVSTYTLYEPESEVFSYPTSNIVSSSEWNGKSSFFTDISTKESSEKTDTS